MLLCFFWLAAYIIALTQGFGCPPPPLLQPWGRLFFLFSLGTSAILFYKRHSESSSQCRVAGHTLYSCFGIESAEKESLGQMSLSTWQFKNVSKIVHVHAHTHTHSWSYDRSLRTGLLKKKNEEERKELASYLTSLCHDSISYLALTISSLGGSIIALPCCVSFCFTTKWISYYCCCSITMSCPTLSDPLDCSTQGSSVIHYLLEFAQIHVHWVSDAI